jgi:hypothetical protein
MSRARALWVSAPTEIASTPVSAIAAHGVEADAARGLEPGPPGHPPHCLRHLLAGHVVEKNPLRLCGERLLQLLEPVDFNLDRDAGAKRADGGRRFGQCSPLSSNRFAVVVLDHRHRSEVAPVIGAATAPDCVLLEVAQAGGGLPGVQDADAGAGNRIDEGPRQGCGAAHPLQEIQRHTLRLEERPHRSLDGRKMAPPGEPVPVLHVRGGPAAAVEKAEAGRRHVEPCRDAAFFCEERRPALQAGVHDRERRNIVERAVFVEGSSHHRLNHCRVERIKHG